MNLLYIYLIYLLIKYIIKVISKRNSEKHNKNYKSRKQDFIGLDEIKTHREEKSDFKNWMEKLENELSNEFSSIKDIFEDEVSDKPKETANYSKEAEEKSDEKRDLILNLREIEKNNRLTQIQEYEISNALDKILDSDISREIVNQLEALTDRVAELEDKSLEVPLDNTDKSKADEYNWADAIIFSEILAKPKSIRRRG